jgi:hypothetical protein
MPFPDKGIVILLLEYPEVFEKGGTKDCIMNTLAVDFFEFFDTLNVKEQLEKYTPNIGDKFVKTKKGFRFVRPL